MFAAGPAREVGEPQSLVMASDTIVEDTGVFRVADVIVLVMMVGNTRRSEVRWAACRRYAFGQGR